MSFWGVFILILVKPFLYYGVVFNNTIIPLGHAGYKMIITNSYPASASEMISY